MAELLHRNTTTEVGSTSADLGWSSIIAIETKLLNFPLMKNKSEHIYLKSVIRMEDLKKVC